MTREEFNYLVASSRKRGQNPTVYYRPKTLDNVMFEVPLDDVEFLSELPKETQELMSHLDFEHGMFALTYPKLMVDKQRLRVFHISAMTADIEDVVTHKLNGGKVFSTPKYFKEN